MSPDWTDILTAIGTVATAIVAVGVALRAERRVDKRLREERQLYQDREQRAQASAVQVLLVRKESVQPKTSILMAIVTNHGRETITGLQARYSLDRSSILTFARSQRVASHLNLHPDLSAGVKPVESAAYAASLTQWDIALDFESDPTSDDRLGDPVALVRWTDRWGTTWESRRNEIRKVDPGSEWSLTAQDPRPSG